MLELMKKVAKGVMAVLTIGLVVTIASRVISELYDVRLLLAAAAGAFAYKPLVELYSKIKGLE